MKPKLLKRTFEAKNCTGKKRAELNDYVVTSEYMTSYKWVVIDDKFHRAFVTKTEAEQYIKEHY